MWVEMTLPLEAVLCSLPTANTTYLAISHSKPTNALYKFVLIDIIIFHLHVSCTLMRIIKVSCNKNAFDIHILILLD